VKRALLLPLCYLALCALPLTTDGQKPNVNRAPKPIIPQPTVASIINLIATPERYDGKMVSVAGFLAVESGSALRADRWSF
jgi:hypothetical protein